MIAKQVLKRAVIVLFLLCLWLFPRGVRAQTALYWDNNNAFGAGPNGPWDTTSPIWSPNPGGVAPGLQTNWVQGDSAVFSASGLPGANQSFNVALSQNLTVANLTYTGGNGGSQLSIIPGAGNTINMANSQMFVAVDPGTKLFLEPVIADPIVGLAGTLILQSGNLDLAGANTYSGGTVVTGGGTVIVGNDAGLGAAAGGVTLFNGELLTSTTGFSSARAINLSSMGESIDTLAAFTGTTATYTGVISGNGNLTVGDGTNTGTVVLTGNNTYTGGFTIINQLTTLQIGNGGPTGSIPGNVLDFGNLAFKRSDDIIFSGIVSGAGTLSQISPGTLTLTGDNSYSGGTIISHNGTISVDSDPELGAAPEEPGIGGITLQAGELLTTADGFNTARGILVSPASLGPDILAAANNTTAFYNGVISGAGLLDIGDGTNAGNIVFTGTNTYSGGTTIFGVTLQIGIGGTNGSIVGNVLDFGNLTFDRSDAITFAGIVSGAGALNQIGSGTLTLTGTNTYSGGTFVSGGGTVSVATDANLGATGVGIGGITLQNGELLTTGIAFNTARTIDLSLIVPLEGAADTLAAATGTTATYTGLISGVGPLTVGDGENAGTVVFTAANSYGGGTTILGGTLQIGNGGITGSILGNVVDSGNLAFNHSDNITFTGDVSGSGTLSQIGPGTLILTGTNSYSGGTIVSGGILSVDNDVELGTGGITLQGGELLTTLAGFSTARTIDVSLTLGSNTIAAVTGTTATYTGALIDTGALVIGDSTNAGTVVFTGTNTYSGGTTISAGTLQIGNGGIFGSIVGNVTDNSNLVFDHSDNITFTGDVSGTGTLNQIGSGTLILIGTNNYSGVTTISAGTLQIGNGGTTGSIVGNVTDNSNLAFNHSDNITFAGDVSGSGTLSQIGPGTLILTGNNSYEGGTIVSGGILSVNNDAELGATGLGIGGITLQGGELLTTIAGFSTARTIDVSLTLGSNTIAAVTGTTATYTGALSDTGALVIGDSTNAGTIVFTGTNTYSGGTTINFGTLQLGNLLTTGSIVGAVVNNSTFDIVNANTAGITTITNNNGGTTDFNASTAANATITNNAGGVTDFIGISTAGAAIIINNIGGRTQFFDTSTAGTAQITNSGGEENFGQTDFHNLSTAANATITNNGGETKFFDTSNAGNAQITNFAESEENIGETDFNNTSNAANATIANNNRGLTQFFDTSNAANARITNSGEGEGEGGLTEFRGASTAANATINNFGGNTAFNDTSTADHATITNTAGQTDFNNTSTAANATINNNSGATFFGGASTAANSSITTNEEGLTEFLGTSTAANATITSSGETFFVQNSTAGNATIVTNTNGLTLFGGTSTGGQASFITNAGGIMDISQLSSGGMTAGSIAGAGTYSLGSKALTVGNEASTEVSGTIVDGGEGGGAGGALIKVGSGTLTLSGANTYTGGTTITTGTLQIGNGGGTGSILGDVVNNAALVVNRSGTLELDGAISGTGNLSQVGSGTLVLTGTSTYTGATAVSAGTLQVDGVLGNTAVTVQNAATLAGKGTIGGSVTILDGGHLAPGPGPQTLSVGTLSLNPASILDYQLGRPGAVGSGFNTLVNVAGNLTLDGVLNVTETEGGQFGSGAYRLLNYKGALTDLTLNLGTLPTGFSTLNTTVNTAVPGQVNLVVNAANAPTQFWDGPNTVNDGTIHGGTGTWVNFTTTNFTNAAGEVNQAWQNGVAIFTATPGTVTVGADILFQGIEFSSDGYTLVGSGAFALHPTGTATIITDTDVTATIAAPIVGTGGLNKAGPGLLTLSGHNTYSGGTTISDGALSVASDTNLGAANVGLELNGGELETSADFSTPRAIALMANLKGANILAAADNTTATYAGLISGAGGLSVGDGVNTGTVVLTNFNNSYSGGTSILPGTLVAAGNDALGTGPAQLFNGTLIIPVGVTLPNEVTFATGGVFNNAGTLNNNVLGTSAGTQMLINSGIINGNVTLGGATDIVQLFTGSKITGSLGLNGTSSTLILDGAGQQSMSLAVVGTLTNNGLLVKQGSGTWTIDRALDAPLGTDILAGTLAVDTVLTAPLVNIATGATLQLNLGGSVGNVVDNGSLIFASTGTVNFDKVISGSGNVIQDGPGTTILSGRNTYSGGTIVDLGTLLVNNAQALGTGNVTVNGGVLGADPQPINVLGNYTQNAAGTLQLNIAGRSAGQFDLLNVNGNAFLNGTLRLVNGGYQPQLGDSLRLINAGGVVTGRFAQFQNPFALTDGFNTVDLVYARQSVTLEFLEVNGPPSVVSTTDFSSFAFTPNERAAASLLDAVQLDPRAANLISFLNKEPFANLPGDFNKISPADLSAFYEISFSNANIQRLNLESRMDDLHNGSNGFSSNMKVNGATVNTDDRTGGDGKSSKAVVEPILQPGPGNRWGVWMTGFGDFVSVDGDANAAGYNFTTGGVSLGIDYRLTDELVVGVMAEYSHTWTSLKPSGNNDVNSGRGGVYATWAHHGFYLNGAVYGGYNSYNSSRSALQGLASGNTEGAELSTFISGGYDFHFGPLTVGPVAALQYTYVNIDGFSENGSLAPMQLQTASANSLRSDVGFRLFYQWQVGKIIIEPSLKAAWEHEYLYSALPVTAGFAGIPGPTATFTGPAEGHDSAIVSAGVSVLWTPTLTTYLNYDGQLGRGNYSSNAVTGGVRINF